MKKKIDLRASKRIRAISATVIALTISSLSLSAQTETSSAAFTFSDSAWKTNYVFLYDWIPTELTATSDMMTGECAAVNWNKPKSPTSGNITPIRNYVLQWSKNSDFSGASSLSFTSPDDYSYTSTRITKLSLNTRYYLRVRAINDYTTNGWSEVFSFVTFNQNIFGTTCT